MTVRIAGQSFEMPRPAIINSAIAMSGSGPSRKWCRRDTASEMHRLVDIGLLATAVAG